MGTKSPVTFQTIKINTSALVNCSCNDKGARNSVKINDFENLKQFQTNISNCAATMFKISSAMLKLSSNGMIHNGIQASTAAALRRSLL